MQLALFEHGLAPMANSYQGVPEFVEFVEKHTRKKPIHVVEN